MVEQIEELGAESQILTFAQLKRLAHREVDVHLVGAINAIARRVPKTGSPVRTDDGIRHIGGGIDPVRNLRRQVARLQGIGATEAGSESRGSNRVAGQIVVRPTGSI